ncbi:MAG TPA: UDPGP type 1 family protein [Tepidisphaeraceae bacterium]|nr:UDPGP type 1 family protein [Tepidisphaeraceae bacterium]
MDISSLRGQLQSIDQAQVLRFYDSLPAPSRARLEGQLSSQNLPMLNELSQQYVKHKPQIQIPKDIRPVEMFPRHPRDEQQKNLYQQAQQRGTELLKGGKVAAFLVAGGQGTRLGYDGPKGEYPVTPIKNKPLFQCFAEQLRGWSRDVGKTIPWYIMTSDINDRPTREFFEKHRYFGCNPADVFFFQQGMMPAISMDGRLLLAEKDSLALSPDGHGGSLRALDRSGALADMRRRGIEHLSYFQVDNPLVHCIDPLFLGLHDLTGSEMSSKTIPKAHALEKVGNFVNGDGVVQVIEYSDLPQNLAELKNGDGSLRFNAGSIAIHALRVSFIERLNNGGQLKLPWHRAEKKVDFVDEQGQLQKPKEPNAVKLEQFVFDAIPLAKNAMVYETERGEEFSPVKNAQGTDSPASCRRDQVRRSARWLSSAGVQVPEKSGEIDAIIEISPLFANNEQQLKERFKQKPALTIRPSEQLYLE